MIQLLYQGRHKFKREGSSKPPANYVAKEARSGSLDFSWIFILFFLSHWDFCSNSGWIVS